MRDLKFRAWDKMNSIFIYFTVKLGEETFLDPTIYDEELYLYTGLLDKHGSEIYEGDIVRVVEDLTTTDMDRIGKRYGFMTPQESGSRSIYGPEYTAPVIWSNKSTGFTLAYKWADTGQIDDHIRITPEETEVIGSIYSNPELLE